MAAQALPVPRNEIGAPGRCGCCGSDRVCGKRSSGSNPLPAAHRETPTGSHRVHLALFFRTLESHRWCRVLWHGFRVVNFSVAMGGHCKGWSFVEVTTGLFLVATVTTMFVFQWQHAREGMALRTAARQVMLDLLGIRLRAAATNRSHRLVFPAAAASYQRQWRIGSTYTNVGPPVSLPAGVTVASCNAAGQAITFRPRGNAATFGTIVLRNRRGAQRQVVVDIAGRVRLQE